MVSFPQSLDKHRAAIEEALRASLPRSASPLGPAANYVLGWEDVDGSPLISGGKRIRPALCILAAEALGGSVDDALPAAVAVELVHNFSLVHDEVQDRDAERHHRPTTWALLGEAQAINVGDYIFTRAIHTLTSGEGDAAKTMAALSVLNRAIERMIAGQWADIAFESRFDVGVNEYLAMIEGKTGALLGAPMEMGAIMAGADAATAASLGAWGRAVGLAFQTWDDYLGIWGDPAVTGKPSGSDILRRKKSYPVVYGLADATAASLIRDAFARGEVSEVAAEEIRRALEAAGAREDCAGAAGHYSDKADHALDSTPISPAFRDDLREIAAYLANRPA